MTTRRDLNELAALGSRTVELARAELEAFFYGLDLTRPELARDALLEFMPMLAQEYGDVAATAAAEWYEAQRFAQVGGSYAAVLGEGVDTVQAEGSVRYAAGHLFGDNPAQTLALLSGSLQRLVTQGARDAIEQNVGRDPQARRYARVPTGVKTCAWCELLASRGFVYKTAETAGSLGHFHDDCDCQFVPAFGRTTPKIDGYEPDELYARYHAAWNAAGGEHSTSADVARVMRRMYPDRYTDGVYAH